MPFHPIETRRPALRIDGAAPGLRDAVAALDGVATATVVRIGRMPVVAGGPTASTSDRREVTVAAVGLQQFRRLTVQVTADSGPLWQRLADGEVAFTHEQAERLGLDLGGDVRLGTADTPVRVGAFATHTVPPLADAVVGRRLEARLGLADAPRTLLVGVTADGESAEVAATVEQQLGASATVIPDPRRPQPVDPSALGSDDSVWDLLAQCESSGRWHLNSGNGFYGGLQFLPESWRLVGGRGLPHRASRAEQIRRAGRLYERQGWAAWPVCSVRLGLRPPPPSGLGADVLPPES